MHFSGRLYWLGEHQYTTQELTDFMNEDCVDTPQYSLQELGDTIYWQGRPATHRVYPMYLSPDSTQMLWQREDLTIYAPTDGQKQVCISSLNFYRCAQTNGKWVHPHRDHYITLGSFNQKVDVLHLEDDRATVDTYMVTSDWDLEDPSTQEFKYYQSGDTITITGVRNYCERLHIPAVLNGKKVANVFCSLQDEISNLRELVVADGVQRLDFYWSLSSLRVIRLPESVRLICSPDGIKDTQWYYDQPEGPVYFQGYYCGTKGNHTEKKLNLREGTVGICQWADSGRKWDQVTLPTSLTYIARGGLQNPDFPEQVNFPGAAEDLKCYFPALYPGSWNRRLRQWRGGLQDGMQPCFPDEGIFTGKDLYNIGRYHPVIRAELTWQWMPSAPRLQYVDGDWIAEYWYYTADRKQPGYYAAIYIRTGKLNNYRKLDKNAHPSFGPCSTEAYLSPYYLCAEDYLECAANLIMQENPSHESIVQLENWWAHLPNNLLG